MWKTKHKKYKSKNNSDLLLGFGIMVEKMEDDRFA